MRIFNRAAADTPPPDDTDQAAPTGEPTTADGLRRQADQARTDAEADQIIRDARAEADRIIRQAQQQASALNAEARDAERYAGVLEERAQYLAHADTARCSYL
ncbi:hypothetical protein [Streptomyces sp. NPDC057580]|uniref:hypothetical protein n=1 Tax=Streptomyces sp. NPDC057580 TaxID=3346173 RepID=UPI00368FF7DA